MQNKNLEEYRKDHHKELLNMARQHVEALKKLKIDNKPPRDFISETRDSHNNELMIEEIIANENEREPRLNLQLCRTAKAFAVNISKLAETGVSGQQARYITTIQTQGFWHVVGYEANVIEPGKIYIRGFDSLPYSRSQKYFDVIKRDINESIVGNDYQIKLITYAMGQQHSPAGCDVFALSFVLKSLDDQLDQSTISFKDNQGLDLQLVKDERSEKLPISFFKHAQSSDMVSDIFDSSNIIVNKKAQTLIQRFSENLVTQDVFSFTNNEYHSKTFSASIDAKRITFYERLINQLEDKYDIH